MFYTYDQNNSGGSFIRDDNLSQFVIIEADSYKEANRYAEEIGIYFNGVDNGDDCPCCGDRWYPIYTDEYATDIPMLYVETPDNYTPILCKHGDSFCKVHYKKDSRIETYYAEK